MKFWLFFALVVVGAFIWFRTGKRWGKELRGNLVALLVLLLMLSGILILILLTRRLF